MGVNQSTGTQTQGTVDGRPATFFYQRASTEGAGQDGWLKWTEGYQIHPSSRWQQVSTRDVVALAAMPQSDASATSSRERYRLIYIEHDPNAEKDKTVVPIILRHVELTDPPTLAVHDLAIPGPGGSCWFVRHDGVSRGVDSTAAGPHSHVVVSGGSGTGLAESFWRSVAKPFLELVGIREGREYQLHITTNADSISQLAQTVLLPTANRGIRQSIALLSGDGGLLDVLNALVLGERTAAYQAPNVGLLPLGTGNAAAHSAGITARDNTLGLRTWLCGRVTAMPYFRVTFSPGAVYVTDEGRGEATLNIDPATGQATAYGAVVASWGLHASLVADSDTVAYRKFGSERFSMAAKEALFPSDGSAPHVYRGKVSVLRGRDEAGNEKQHWQPLRAESNTHGYILATFMQQLEKGFMISPAAQPVDGKLRIVHFGPMEGAAAMDIMQGAFAGGKHVENPQVGYEEIAGLRIDFEEDDAQWRRICIDGKIVRVEENGWVEIQTVRDERTVLDLVVP